MQSLREEFSRAKLENNPTKADRAEAEETKEKGDSSPLCASQNKEWETAPNAVDHRGGALLL